MPTRKSAVRATPTATLKPPKLPKGVVNMTVPTSMKSVLGSFASKIVTQGAGPTFALKDEATLKSALTTLVGPTEAEAMVGAFKASLVDTEKMFKEGNYPIFPV